MMRTTAPTSGMGQATNRADRIFAILAILAIVFLAFIGGALAMVSKVFPASYIEAAYSGGMALWQKETAYLQVHRTDLWMEARSPDKGVTVNDAARHSGGYTLYSSGDGPHAELISMSGDVLHEWRLPYSRVWDDSAAVKDPQPDNYMYWRKAHAFPNGDLLAIYVAAGDTPWGYGMVKLSRDSKVLWKYLEHTHHSFDIAADGRIYALTHSVESTRYKRFGHLKPPHLEDYVVELSPEGDELKKVSVLQALSNSPYGRMLANVRWYTLKPGDYIHTNDVELITEETAANFPFGKAGQVLVSLRELNTIAVIDLDEAKVVWAASGSWVGQHDIDLLADGHLLLFDNLGRFDGGDGNRSRLLEFDPATMEITWSYQGSAEHPFDSEVRAAQQRLADGNTLVTESSGGRLFEISSEGRIVWEFFNPVRYELKNDNNPDQQPRQLTPVISWAQRIPRDSIQPGWLDN